MIEIWYVGKKVGTAIVTEVINNDTKEIFSIILPTHPIITGNITLENNKKRRWAGGKWVDAD